MQKLTLLMLVAATTFEFLVRGDAWGRWALLPNGAQYMPEILSIVAAVVVVIAGTRSRFRNVRAAYWLTFAALATCIVCGVLANGVDAGPMFAGLRNYLRAMPWLLLPAVAAFSEAQVKTQLRWLLVISAVQVPLAVHQRWTLWSEGRFTGDYVSGTLLASSSVSIFQIAVVCIGIALMVRQFVSRTQLLVVSVFLLIPATINETKATLFLLPVGALVAWSLASPPGRRIRAVVMTAALTVGFAAVYFPVYEYFNAARTYRIPLAELLTDPALLEGYLRKTEDIGEDRPAGRVDAVIVPLSRLSNDPGQLAFGLGIGNASHSTLGRSFIGEYFGLYGTYLVTSMGRVLLELGVLGALLIGLLLWLIGRDCIVVARQRAGIVSALAAGWAGVTLIMGLALFYKDTIISTPLSFVFWYMSGLVVAERMRACGAHRELAERYAEATRREPVVSLTNEAAGSR